MNNVNVQRVSKDDVIRAVADSACLSIGDVRSVFRALNDVLPTFLEKADENNKVTVKLLEGFYIDSVYLPECQKMNNLTGKIVNSPSKIKVKARVTKSYIDRING